MKYFKYLALILAVFLFTGCVEKQRRYMASIKTCERAGGVALLNSSGRMIECKFKSTNEEQSFKLEEKE